MTDHIDAIREREARLALMREQLPRLQAHEAALSEEVAERLAAGKNATDARRERNAVRGEREDLEEAAKLLGKLCKSSSCAGARLVRY